MDHKGINQERVAGRLEVEASTISKLLNGHMRLSDVWMSRIAWALDVELVDLFRDPRSSTQDELLEGLSDDQKSTVLNLIEVLKKTA